MPCLFLSFHVDTDFAICFATFVCTSGCIFQNYGTVGIGEPTRFRVLSGRSLFRSLSFLLPLCNEDTGPVTPALIFRGVTIVLIFVNLTPLINFIFHF
ncbi:hypothetical protein HanIR_Chr09g0414711 [Helianthus annuus]|nr:hypothetical protein HanIR_Chr09g0414711 [Helianthus annuus]